MFQNMNDLQTVAFKTPAYDPVADWNGGKEKLKEVEIQKEAGYREQDFTKAAVRPNKAGNAEMKDAEQNGQQQRNDWPACKHCNLCLVRFRFFSGDEITSRRNQAEFAS